VSGQTLDDRFHELRHTVDYEISRARKEVIAEFARAVSRMRGAATEAEWHEAVLDSGRAFASDPAALEVIASLAALTVPTAATPEHQLPPRPPQTDLRNTEPPPDVMSNAAAQRFARVKVAEIQLYHSAGVKAGRTARDLYGTLKQHIDDARTEFRERFLSNGSGTIGSGTLGSGSLDYLHAEILHALANDDATLLGPNYPGPLA
jgi:hypothetical protein